jgi:hypothetical protein
LIEAPWVFSVELLSDSCVAAHGRVKDVAESGTRPGRLISFFGTHRSPVSRKGGGKRPAREKPMMHVKKRKC